MIDVSVEAIVALVAAATYMFWPYRSNVAFTLAFFNIAHFMIFERTESDILFYVSACTFDVACALTLISQGNRLSIDIALLAIGNALVNIFGLIMWFAYYPPTVYNASIQIIIGLQIARLLLVRLDDVARDTRFCSWRRMVRGYRVRCYRQAEGKAR